jgi:hypothetical protein
MLIAVAPRMDRSRLLWIVSYQCVPRTHPICGEEIDEIPDRDLSRSHGRYLKGFVSGDSRARKVPGAQNIPTAIDRNRLRRLSAVVGERIKFRDSLEHEALNRPGKKRVRMPARVQRAGCSKNCEGRPPRRINCHDADHEGWSHGRACAEHQPRLRASSTAALLLTQLGPVLQPLANFAFETAWRRIIKCVPA